MKKESESGSNESSSSNSDSGSQSSDENEEDSKMEGDGESDGEEGKINEQKQSIEVPLSVIQRFFSKRENLTAFMQKIN